MFVTGVVNARDDAVSNRSHFWDLLSKIEAFACTKFGNFPLVATRHELGAGTVQVQLCEWRQFHGRPRKGLSPQDDANGNRQPGGAVRHALCDSSCRPQGPPKRDRPDQADDLQGRISKSCRKNQGSPSQVPCSGPKMHGRKPCREEDYQRQSRTIPSRLGTTDYGRGGPQKATICRLPFLLGPYVVARAIPWLGRRRCLRTRAICGHLPVPCP